MEKGSIIKIKSLILALIIGNALIFSQSRHRSKKNRTNVEKFVLVSFAQAASPDSVKVVSFIEIPYFALQFVKENGQFIAGYQASISLKRKKGRELGHKVWSDTIRVDSYGDTQSRIKNRKHFYTFTVPVGEIVDVLGELQDADTRKKGIQKKKLNLKHYTKIPSLMPPTILLNFPGDWGFGVGKIPSRGIRVRELGDGIFLDISGFVHNGDYQLSIHLSNSNTTDSLIQIMNGNGSEGFFNQRISIPSSQLKSLKNDFTIELNQGGSSDVERVTFSTYKAGLSSFVYNIDLAMRQMKYILTNEERLQLKGKSKKEKEALFYSVWKKRDQTPETEYNELMEEYYGRIWYANEHFDSWQPGWETDLGMIYILFGPPDEIQRTNPSTSTSSLFQLWSYYQINKQFVFKDQNGFGDYRLETPFLGAGL
jgi:GWxTD domain-containing protein